MTTVAFVPARGGSRDLPGKNIRPFCGRPLIHWCLRALQNARRIDRVVVATDSIEIADVALGFGFPKVEVHRRSAASASDAAAAEQAMLEYLARSGLSDEDVFVLAHATSPFTRAQDIDGALSAFATGAAHSMVSCVPMRRFFWNHEGRPLNYDPQQRPLRQEFDGCLMENGAFYVSKVGSVRKARNRLSGIVLPYVMPAYTGLELDAEDDWYAGEALMRLHNPAVCAPGQQIRMVLTDMDGVLTDGGLYYGADGNEMKKFNTLDGKAFELLRERGIRTGIITAERNRLIAARAQKVGSDYLYEATTDKLGVVMNLCREEDIALSEVVYIGDDVNDLPLLRAVGIAASPRTAVDAVRAAVHYVCERGGGEGCVREVVDRIVLPLLATNIAARGATLPVAELMV